MDDHFDTACTSCGDIAATSDDLLNGDVCYRCASELKAQMQDPPISSYRLYGDYL